MGRGCRTKEREWIEEEGDTGKGGRNGGEKMGKWNEKRGKKEGVGKKEIGEEI
jgi:hypothetical protein